MLASVMLAATVLLSACQGAPRPTRLHGVVVEVQAASFLQVASLTVRTDDGTLVEMTAEGDIGFTPGHLREHMALGDPVTVTVRYADDLTIVTHVEDRLPE